MKILSFLLSCYIMLLCCMPCDDILVAHHPDGPGLALVSFSESHVDHCSPFCTCQCCQANFFTPEKPYIPVTHSSEIAYHEAPQDFHSVDLFEFLIPPKS